MDQAPTRDTATTKLVPSLPGYTAKRLLGRGAFGEVWLAEDMCGLLYAVKVIYRDNPVHRDAEAREFEGLRHYLGVSRENDHLLQIYFVGPSLDKQFFYYVMDLADDANGRDRIRVSQYVPRTLRYEIKNRVGHGSVREVIRLGQALLRGLSSLHEKHLIHRDIKPSNIVFKEGQPKLTDFGLVCLASKWSRAERIGTLHYMPDRGKGTHSADLYSLGKVLWEFWTGADVADFPAIPSQLLENAPNRASNRLNEVINRACNGEPTERYQGWAEMWEALAEIEQTFSPAQVPAPVLPAPQASFVPPPAPFGVISRTSPFYIRREADRLVFDELRNCQKQGGVIRIKGPRKSGKTSLVARALEEARDGGFQVIMADLRQLNETDLKSLESFYRAFAQLIALSVDPEDLQYESDLHYSSNLQLTEFMESQVFARLRGSVLLALDNVERLIPQPYSPDFFSLMRSWYEYRETTRKEWRRFTLLVAYSDDELTLEERMMISPFNVGIRIELGGLSLSEMASLNRAYNGPLVNAEECARFHELTGGQPYLVNLGLYEMARRKIPFPEFESTADEEAGPYRDQLRWVRRHVQAVDGHAEAIAAAHLGRRCPKEQTFLDLQSLGLLQGTQKQPRFACELYARFLRRHFDLAGT